jgi:hypothetical protein
VRHSFALSLKRSFARSDKQRAPDLGVYPIKKKGKVIKYVPETLDWV